MNPKDIQLAAKIILRYTGAIVRRWELRQDNIEESWWEKRTHQYGNGAGFISPVSLTSIPLFPDKLLVFAIGVQGDYPKEVRGAVYDLLPQSKNHDRLNTERGKHILRVAVGMGLYRCILEYVHYEKAWQFTEPRYFVDQHNRVFHHNNDWKEYMSRVQDTY